jgi:hypothetical protein
MDLQVSVVCLYFSALYERVISRSCLYIDSTLLRRHISDSLVYMDELYKMGESYYL